MNTKDKILDFGMTLIQAKGVNGFSFADIAAGVAIQKASIYYYFSGKQALVKAVLDRYSDNFFTALAADHSQDLSGRLTHYVSLYRANLIEGKICLCSDLAMDVNNLDANINAEVGAFFQRNLDWLEQQLGDFHSQVTAAEFFACVQGGQLVSRNQQDVAYFDTVMASCLQRALGVKQP
ncbi:TetR/AcrR family transcriptional regulator [Levilactobacillus acidifarinae]|uniref:Transcriptional regulator n=1 Tax=Levilactobacillus acidifarinae DSM 19394 = JCM 15949 TaxID=1423715 RepID=A0A0R1LRS6_9LACO|nr:TetR/AcrR family transcriptional regulator [Levilactobacillus acidifarinae]KRK94970.1 transcriptional regulator [Levilactobacillus acidifarinae DSM 19394]GEO70102.1 TetR family transcriptional regulator [Levilactobacillus acidifarinae]